MRNEPSTELKPPKRNSAPLSGPSGPSTASPCATMAVITRSAWPFACSKSYARSRDGLYAAMLFAVCMMIGYAHNVSPANAMAASLRGRRNSFGQLSQAPAQRSRLSEAKTSSFDSPYSRIQAQAMVTRCCSLEASSRPESDGPSLRTRAGMRRHRQTTDRRVDAPSRQSHRPRVLLMSLPMRRRSRCRRDVNSSRPQESFTVRANRTAANGAAAAGPTLQTRTTTQSMWHSGAPMCRDRGSRSGRLVSA